MKATHRSSCGRPLSGGEAEQVLRFDVRRRGLIGFLLRVLRPDSCKEIWVGADAIGIEWARRSESIPIGNVDEVCLQSGLKRSRVTLRHERGKISASGLSAALGKDLATAVEAARESWWRSRLSDWAELYSPIHKRIEALSAPLQFVTSDSANRLRADAEAAVSGLSSRLPASLSGDSRAAMLQALREFLKAPDEIRLKANHAFVNSELKRSQDLFDTIDSKPLTDEQRKAVVADDSRNLVVAAAGSGKTSVIAAKAGWLVRRGFRRPSELLLLAFARDARQEMQDRLNRCLGADIAEGMSVQTFHSLGLSIVGEAEGRRPSLAKYSEDPQAMAGFLTAAVQDLLADGELSESLLEWFRDQFAPYRSEHEFKSWGEYWDYIRRYDIRSLNGDAVKSFEECEIANFLYLNGIAYRYEAAYEHDTATAQKRQYSPDFHLPEQGIYIEHFGLDANGNTAPFVDRDEYLKGVEWKRNVHSEHGTALIETFSYECAEGSLIRNLTAKLTERGVQFRPIPRGQIFALLETQKRIKPFYRLLATFLQHFKGEAGCHMPT